MATTSIADKLAKLEKKIAKRQATIAEEQTQLDKELAEYDRLYLTALASKYKLSGKDLFSAIEREHEQLEKLREGGMKMQKTPYNKSPYSYRCGMHVRYGKGYCSSHNIKGTILEGAILQDIKRQIDFVMNDGEARAKYLARKRGNIAEKFAEDRKRKREIEKRIDDLGKLIRKVYEDRVLGNLPDKTCTELLADYQQEKETLQAELDELLKRSETMAQDEADVDEYIRRLKSYAGVDTLTRQMAMDLLEYVTVDRYEGEGKPRSIHIYYKLIDKPLRDKNNALA